MFPLARRRAKEVEDREAVRSADAALPAGTGRVECQVVDPVGLPMRATVALLDRNGGRVVEGCTGAFGFFTAVVPPGDYTLSIGSDGYHSRETPLRVSDGAQTSAGVIGLTAEPPLPTPGPGRWDLDPEHTAIRFAVRHVGLAAVHGRFNRFSGSLWVGERMRHSRLEVHIEAGSIDTGVAARDEHLRSPDFLDVRAHPYVLFRGDEFVHRGGSQWTVTGVLAVRGVSRPVRLDTAYLGMGTGMNGEVRVACEAVTELNREHFGVTWQQRLARGVAAVGTTIGVELDIQLTEATQLGSQLPVG